MTRHGSLPVPLHLRNAPTALMKQLGHGRAYRYAHDEPDAYAAGEQYLPEAVGRRATITRCRAVWSCASVSGWPFCANATDRRGRTTPGARVEPMKDWMIPLAVGLGGGAGSMARYALGT